MLRKLLRISSRVGRPGTLLSLDDSGGRLLYLSAQMTPVSVIVGLEPGDVRDLHAALGEWLEAHDDAPAHVPAPLYTSADGRSWEPAPLVAGRIGAGLRDVAAAPTVQLCTVPGPAHPV